MEGGLPSVECPEPVEGLHWIYILHCCNGAYYVGQSSEVRRRLRRHRDGFGARHTQILKEFNLVYVEGPMEMESAVSREQQPKKWSRQKKLALIRGDLDLLRT